jgi:hypothetical protein
VRVAPESTTKISSVIGNSTFQEVAAGGGARPGRAGRVERGSV